ncbi:hypothetical protein HaLaN_26940 [Haematococcus lacustris]|uniref:Uncharacterized protein n=1 Tax=Haematococcus lacustris TaxID=44745 RepID=A0A6A0A766_HAELA|nr:hypothetical protein HaLaN_26940 [Haematococcus lacustris]
MLVAVAVVVMMLLPAAVQQGGALDAVLCVNGLQYLTHPEAVLQEAYQRDDSQRLHLVTRSGLALAALLACGCVTLSWMRYYLV